MEDKKKKEIIALNKRKKVITAYFQNKFKAFLPILKYNKDKIIIKENEIGMLYGCSVIFNPNMKINKNTK